MPLEVLIEKCPFPLERLQREVNILLISDLHYDVNKSAMGNDGKEINKQLVKSLPAKDSEWAPDIVIVAGDLVNQNKEESYALYFDLIEALVTKYRNLRHAVFSTPGNHDVSRKKFMGVLQYMFELHRLNVSLKNSYTSNSYVDMLMTITKKQFTSTPDLRQFLQNYEAEYFDLYLKMRDELAKKEINGSHDTILAPLKVEYPNPGFKTTYFTSLHGITLVCHNSSFFCNISQSSNDRNNLFLVRDLVEPTIKAAPANEPVVSFMHHPFYYLHESEHVAPVPVDGEPDEYNNFTKIVRASDLVLSGHVHGDLHDPAYLHDSAYLITNGASFANEDFEGKCYPYTYALIKINKQLRRFTLKKYFYKESTRGKPDSRDYVVDPKAKDAYYFFKKREGVQPTSVQFEYVRTLDYFMKLPEYQTKYQLFEFLVYQLQSYHAEWENAGKQTYNITTTRKSFADMDEIAISHPKDPNLNVRIFKADDPSVMSFLESVLLEKFNKFRHDDAIVYFAINIARLKDKQGKLSKNQIDNLVAAFQNLVQLAKRHYISTNLLYYQETNT